MKTIFKYQLEITDVQTLQIPVNSTILSVQLQNDTLCMWVLVNTENKIENVNIHIFGTGHEINPEIPLAYISTVQLYGGKLIFHIFKEF